MCAEDIHTLFKRLFTDVKKKDALIHVYSVNLVALLKFSALFKLLFKLNVAGFFNHVDNNVDAFSLGLAIVKEISVVLI